MDVAFSKKKLSTKTMNVTDINYSSYFLYEYIGTQIGDPISSLFLNEKYAIIGTMMGKIILLQLNTENKKRISINTYNSQSRYIPEHITGISLSDDYTVLFASIGDEKIIKQDIKEPLSNNNSPKDFINIYINDNEHYLNCDTSYVIMATYNLIKINIFLPETEEKIKDDVFISYDVIWFNDKEYTTNKNHKGRIQSTNFFLPMDFDGCNFCWIEYINDKKDRNICIQNVCKDDIITDIDFKFPIDKNYGHISHVKLLAKNKILIVHKLNKCEIRDISKTWDLLEQFTHIGDEVYAVNIYYNDNNTFYGDNKVYLKTKLKKNNFDPYEIKIDNIPKMYNNNYDKMNESQKLTGKIILPKIENVRNKKISVANSSEIKTDSLNLIQNKTKKKNNDDNISLAIITLDIDGNVNKYENESEEKLFNLYDIKGIEQDQKDKQLFNMGYVYYIKTDLNFFCISTDHGCYIIKKNE